MIMGFESQFLLQLSLLFLICSISASAVTITPGSSLYVSNPNHTTWSSPNNTFSLGFLPADPPTSPPSFIAAIFFAGGVPIWSAVNSSGAPASVDSRGALHFLSSGSLRLVNGANATVWDSNTAGLGVTSALLDDSGNLVLRNGSSASSVWSTFDNPADTIVPSQNFTADQVLRSGSYSLRLLRNGSLTLYWNNSIEYWSQGGSSPDGNLTSPTLALQSIGILSISDPRLPTPSIVAYSNDYAEGTDILRFLKLDSDGNLRIYSSARGSGTKTKRWAAVSDQCQVFGYCGNNGICSYDEHSNPVCGCASPNFEPVDPRDSRKGCRRKVEIEDCPGNATMLELEHTEFLTYAPEADSQAFFVGISACRLNCLVAGSCVASTLLNDGSGLCSFKTAGFVSGYVSPATPSTSYVKVCGPVN